VTDLSTLVVCKITAKLLKRCEFKPGNAKQSAQYLSLGLPKEPACQRQRGGQTQARQAWLQPRHRTRSHPAATNCSGPPADC